MSERGPGSQFSGVFLMVYMAGRQWAEAQEQTD
jgi:hypothetical protein